MTESARVRSTCHRAFISAAAALAAIIGCVASASAGTYYVSPIGSDGNSGTSPGSSWGTVAKANNALRAGDTVYLLPGTYSDQINPVNSGTANARITYLGNIDRPGDATVSAFTFYGDDYTTIKGLTCTGEISCDATSGGSSSDWDSISTCVVKGGITTAGAWHCVFSNNTIGTPGSVNTKWLVQTNPSQMDGNGHIIPPASITAYCTYADNTMYMGAATANPCVSFAHMHNNQFLRNKIYMYLPPGGEDAGIMCYGIWNNTFAGNSWIMKNNSAAEHYMMCLRDSSRFNTWSGDTFMDDASSTNSSKIYFCASGTYVGSVGYNTFNGCLINLKGPAMYQNSSRGDLFANNVIISPDAFSPMGDSLTFIHNTFYTSGAKGIDVPSNAPATNMTWQYNILYQKSGGVHTYLQDTGSPHIDYNLYYSPAGDSTNATYQGRVGPGTTWCTSRGNDCHSHWGNPSFLSVVPSNLDLRVAANSLALSSSLWPDGYVGAGDGSAQPRDLIPPSAINDLHTSP